MPDEIQEALFAKEEAMGRVDANAAPDWKVAAALAVDTLAHSREEFTSEDVLDHVKMMYPGLTTHEMRALGPVMLRAAKSGLIEKGGFDLYRAKSRHRAPVQKWRSLVYSPAGSGTIW